RPTVKLIAGLLVVFAFLSLADLFLTWRLIDAGDGQVLESNPVANWWLVTYGWGGMTLFKLGMIVVVGALAGGIACCRPRTSEMILVFACGAQSTVVLHSVFLAGMMEDQPPSVANVFWPSLADPEPDSKGGPRRPYGPDPLPENGLLLLLTHKS